MNIGFQRDCALEMIQDTILDISVIDFDKYVKNDDDCIDILSFFELYSTKFNIDIFQINKTINAIIKADTLLSEIMKFIRKLKPIEFEKLAAIICKCLSFEDSYLATRQTKDEGLDFIAWRDFSKLKIDRKEYIIGQCKHFKKKLVDLKDIRELSGSAMLFSRQEFATTIYGDYVFGAFAPVSVFYITNYFFSPDAEKLCRTTHIVPLDVIDITCICFEGIKKGKIDWADSKNKLDRKKALREIQNIQIAK